MNDREIAALLTDERDRHECRVAMILHDAKQAWNGYTVNQK